MARLCCVLIALISLTTAAAQAPGPADVFQPNPEYLLSARQGPFMIYVASFRGDRAGPLAQDLVAELRKTYKLQAFLLRRIDEDAAAERDRIRQEELKRYGPEFKRGKKVLVLEDWAVLVGNYATFDKAADDLKRIKQVEKPRNLDIFPHLQQYTNPLAETRKPGKVTEAQQLQDTRIETFRRAFVAPNPLAPRAAVARGNDDQQTLQAWNESEKYSLLRNPGTFSLVVMEFRAPVEVQDDSPSVFDQKNMAAFRSPYAPDHRHLEHAVALARQLRDQLNDNGKGYEAFLLHTKNATLVTVGSFKSADDPEMQKVVRALAGLNVGGIQLLRTPYPCQVPRS